MQPMIGNERFAEWVDKVAFWLLLAVFFTIPMNTLRIHGVAIGDFFVFGLICLFPVTVLTRGFPWASVPKWMLVSLGLFALSLVLVLAFPFEFSAELQRRLTNMGDPYSSSAVIWVRFMFALLAFPVIIGQLSRNWKQLQWIALAWVGGVMLSCLVAVYDAALGLHLEEAVSYDPENVKRLMGAWMKPDYDRFVGLTDHPNTLGITSVMASPILLVRLGSKRGLLRFGLPFLLVVAGVFLSGSRTALLGFIVASLVVIIFYREQILLPVKRFFSGPNARLKIAAAVAVCLLAFAGLAAAAVHRDQSTLLSSSETIDRILDPSGESAKISNNERSIAFHASVDAFKANPVIGSGYIWIETPHNIVLAMLVSGGILGLLGFICAAGGYVREGFLLRRIVGPGELALVTAMLASFISYLAMALLGNQAFNRYLYLPVGLIMAGRMLMIRQASKE